MGLPPNFPPQRQPQGQPQAPLPGGGGPNGQMVPGADYPDSPSSSSPTALSSEQVLERYSGHLSTLLSRHVLSSFDHEKTWQYLDLRRNYAYFKGNHYSVPALSGGFVDYRPLQGSNALAPTHTDFDSPYDYVCNIYKGDVRKLVAVVGQRPPNVQATPRTENDETQVTRARKAQLAADFWFEAIDAAESQRDLVFSLGVAGTTFGYVRYVADQDRYGSTSEPVFKTQDITIAEESYLCQDPNCQASGPIEESPSVAPPTNDFPGEAICPHCGAPASIEPPVIESISIESDETKTYANGGVEIDLCNGLTVTTPFSIKKLADSPWILYQYEEDHGKLLQAHPVLRNKHLLKRAPILATDSLGETSREEARSLSGSSYSRSRDRDLYSRFWLRPSMFEYLDNDDDRAQLKSQYPRGLKITAVNGDIVKLESESMDEVWVPCKPDQDEGLWTQGYLNDMIQCADVVDDSINILVELLEKGIPLNLTDTSVIDPKILNQKGRRVGEFIAAMRRPGGTFKDSVHTLKAAEIDSNLPAIIDVFINLYRQGVTGLTPAVYGGGSYNTAREAEIARSQALSMLATLWSNTRSFWQTASLLAVRQLARYTDGTLYRIDGDEQDALHIDNLHDLLNGGYSFNSTEGFPMNAAQVSDKITAMFESPNPEVPERLGAFEPENLPSIEAAMGLPGWKIPDAEARKYMMGIIGRLLGEQPVQQINPMTGQPEQLSSIAASDIVMDPQFAIRMIRSWIHKEGDMIESSNPDGFLNVMLYANGYKEMLMPPPEMGAPMGDGAGAGAGQPSGPPPPADGVPLPTDAELPLPPEVQEGAMSEVIQ